MATKNTTKAKVTAPTGSRADERLVRSGAPEVRGDRGVAEDAARAGDTGLLSLDELENLIKSEFEQTVLPDAPKIPGYHICWLTSGSQYDTLAKRQRLGYTAVRRSELPGFDPSNGQQLQGHEGIITCNEMVLHKIPEAHYQAIMRYFHHKRPLEDEQSILAKSKELSEGGQDSSGKDLMSVEGDGIKDLEARVRRDERSAVPMFN